MRKDSGGFVRPVTATGYAAIRLFVKMTQRHNDLRTLFEWIVVSSRVLEMVPLLARALALVLFRAQN
jgi:hypothetical protein